MGLEGKVVLIVGGAGALGHTVTPAFVKAGARVVVMGREIPRGQPAGQIAVAADVTDERSVQRAIAEVIQQAGRIDCAINLVGGFTLGRLVDTEASLWQKMLSLNLTAAFLVSRAVVSHMVERGHGRIVHMVARAALEPFPGAAAYIVAKSGLATLVRVLAMELAGTGVTVNGILPTTIDTPANRKSMPDTDPSKWVKPESIARLLLFLSSEDAGELNGALIPIGSA